MVGSLFFRPETIGPLQTTEGNSPPTITRNVFYRIGSQRKPIYGCGKPAGRK
mgnify:CR=1 FL=1